MTAYTFIIPQDKKMSIKKRKHLTGGIKRSKKEKVFRNVAQPGRALRSGRRGRRFKSCHSDQL